MSKVILEWLGSTPCDEDCAQTTQANFSQLNQAECIRYKALLEKICPSPNENAYYRIKGSDHDFATYREVVLMAEESVSDEDIKAINEWQLKVQRLPSTWIELEALVPATLTSA